MIAKWIDDLGLGQMVCLWALVAFVLVGAVVALSLVIHSFSKELKYLNCEIRRTSGDERAHWMRRRRQLWLSLIPFVKY